MISTPTLTPIAPPKPTPTHKPSRAPNLLGQQEIACESKRTQPLDQMIAGCLLSPKATAPV